MTAKEAVLDFIGAANNLRVHPHIEIGFALADLMREMPIKVSYALFVPAQIYAGEIKSRLPEE